MPEGTVDGMISTQEDTTGLPINQAQEFMAFRVHSLEEEEEEERQNVMVRGVTNGGLSHGNPHDNKQPTPNHQDQSKSWMGFGS